MNINDDQRSALFHAIRAGRALLSAAEAFLKGDERAATPPPPPSTTTAVDDEIARQKARKLLASAGIVPRQP